MDKTLIDIKNLSVVIGEKKILDGFSLTVNKGEIHAIMGPNGAGKSTLAKVLAGDPSYEVVSGSVHFKGKDLLELDPEERAHLGLFMGFQYPVEIKGVSNAQLLEYALNAKRKFLGLEPLLTSSFAQLLEEKMALLKVKEEFKERGVNEGFSGGEKKRSEIVQMAVLEPDLAILDETDSGLDIDAMRIVSEGVKSVQNKERALILITHYQRLLGYIRPDFVHVMVAGKIMETGGFELCAKLEEQGYSWADDS